MIETIANHIERVSFTDCELVPMNAALATYLEDLARALARGYVAPDANRKGFFDVIAGNQWFYIHVEPKTGTAYLIAHQVVAST